MRSWWRQICRKRVFVLYMGCLQRLLLFILCVCNNNKKGLSCDHTNRTSSDKIKKLWHKVSSSSQLFLSKRIIVTNMILFVCFVLFLFVLVLLFFGFIGLFFFSVCVCERERERERVLFVCYFSFCYVLLLLFCLVLLKYFMNLLHLGSAFRVKPSAVY